MAWFAKGRDLVAFLRCEHKPQAIGPAAAKTQQRRAPSTLAAAVSRGQGLSCFVLCVLSECVCVWSSTSGTKGAGPANKNVQSSQQSSDRSCFCTNTRTTHTRQNEPYRLGVVPAGVVGARGRCCTAATVPVAVVFACAVCCCIAEEIQNKIIDRKTELCHHHPPSKAHSNEYENNTHKSFKMGFWVCGFGGVRDVHGLICTRVVQIEVAALTAQRANSPYPQNSTLHKPLQLRVALRYFTCCKA